VLNSKPGKRSGGVDVFIPSLDFRVEMGRVKKVGATEDLSERQRREERVIMLHGESNG
jgi:hypothetical protein